MSCRNCHHARDAHEHFRRGSDCAACDCAKFQTSVLEAVASLVRRHHVVEPIAPASEHKHVSAA